MVSKKWYTDQNYLLIDPETAPKSSPDRSFVYIVLLNEPGNPNHHPIFVGHTDNLEKRLNSHKAISWHVEKFKEKPLIWIAGTVLFIHAEKSVIDLETKLSNKGFLIFQKVIKRGNPRIENLSSESLKFYTAKKMNSDDVVVNWASQWKAKTKYIQGEEKGRDSNESQDATQENLRLALPNKEELLTVIRKQKYGSNAATLMAQKLAMSFNETNGRATYLLPRKSNPKNAEYAIKLFKENAHQVSADWKFIGKTVHGEQEVAVFELTVNLKRKISRVKAETDSAM